MSDFPLVHALCYAVLPVSSLLVCAFCALKWQISNTSRSQFQHIAAGVVMASVTVELVPVLLRTASISGTLFGYCLGVVSMLLMERYADQFGAQLAIGVDLFIDGFLLMIGFATGEQGGFLLLLGLTLETTSLGFVVGPNLKQQGLAYRKMTFTLLSLGMAIFAGAGLGLLLPEHNGFQFAALLGFGVAALLYLVVEELLTEAHETEDTSLTTALFFAGFLVPLVLVQLSA